MCENASRQARRLRQLAGLFAGISAGLTAIVRCSLSATGGPAFWLCGTCGERNTANRTTCLRCGAG
jgi:transcription elongation factor Elf1